MLVQRVMIGSTMILFFTCEAYLAVILPDFYANHKVTVREVYLLMVIATILGLIIWIDALTGWPWPWS